MVWVRMGVGHTAADKATRVETMDRNGTTWTQPTGLRPVWLENRQKGTETEIWARSDGEELWGPSSPGAVT